MSGGDIHKDAARFLDLVGEMANYVTELLAENRDLRAELARVEEAHDEQIATQFKEIERLHAQIIEDGQRIADLRRGIEGEAEA